jgi:NADPH-dependent 2,4-dienoyl-CoA reductase/sulfur reductase-like enzyme
MTVWSLDADRVLGVSAGGRSRLIEAGRVIIATGALERPFPIPGWTLPGVMTVGAGQTLLKTSGIVPDGRTVIAGLGPLIWLFAAQVLRAGGRIDAILDTTPAGSLLRAAPHAPAFLLTPLWLKGLRLMQEVKARVPIIRGIDGLAAEGELAVKAVTYTAGAGRAGRYEVDTLLLHQGVVPNVNLAMAAGVEHRWSEDQLCFVPVLDQDGGTSLDGIAIAGDGAGIGGAWAAEERGRLVAIAAIRALRPGVSVPDDQAIRQRLQRHQHGRRFLDILYRAPDRFRRPADATIACRCEEVAAGEVRAAAAGGCEGPNQLKAFLRCGMGPCQGRLCGLTITELIAETRGSTPAEVGYYRLRPPVKPIALGELAGLPAGDEAQKAVVRL